MEMIIALLLITSLVVNFVQYRHLERLKDDFTKFQEDNADRLSDQLSYQLTMANKEQELVINKDFNKLQTEFYQYFHDVREVLEQQLRENRQTTDQRLNAMQEQLSHSVQTMTDSTDKRLESIRLTVEEKLESTLHSRLKLSFEHVSKQLESVNQGLGEMRTVAKDVGALNKVLSNTKTRGILGELQLGQIIEDIMTEQQYGREVPTVSGSNDRVEYAIKLPGQAKDSYIYLPIDSKFPLESYYQLEEAYEQGDKELIDLHRKNLLASVKRFAKDINTKYLNPPETTHFGIMFLPTEGLYSEIVRNAAFFDRLRREENVLVAGPSTLSALLNSLSVGFKTLNLQKNADDISYILGNVRTEFGKYQGMLAKTQKQLATASKTLDNLLTTRTTAVFKALDKMESGDHQEAMIQLGRFDHSSSIDKIVEPSQED